MMEIYALEVGTLLLVFMAGSIIAVTDSMRE